jgi:hypothetical protein
MERLIWALASKKIAARTGVFQSDWQELEALTWFGDPAEYLKYSAGIKNTKPGQMPFTGRNHQPAIFAEASNSE